MIELETDSLPLVSFVIPAYNAAVYIIRAIDSALNQTYPRIEVIIVDDGSTDQTAAVIRERYGNEARIQYVYQSNAGPSAARN
ncbi:MAG TPA: glycosyltransferase family A protein, partial [Phototrophicaceae bacterium]|nr:glycosyltransferase family A protein [Phototrophicaceae bacterium]